MQWVKVKPASGKSVRDPVTKQPLPEDGARVCKCPYWNRRIKDGSVVVVTAAATKRKPAKVDKTDAKTSDAQAFAFNGGE